MMLTIDIYDWGISGVIDPFKVVVKTIQVIIKDVLKVIKVMMLITQQVVKVEI